jgi:hypothetical protein
MKTVVRRSLTILMCAGTLIAGTQSWAKDVSTSSATKTVKAQNLVKWKKMTRLSKIIVNISLLTHLTCQKWIIL